jgi:predicted AAA+ superfamily ATPase
MLNKFVELSERAIEFTDVDFVRSQISYLQQPERLIGIKGSRGVGKTTLLLQFAKLHLSNNRKIYISLDNPYFAKNNLLEFVDEFVKNGGEYLLLDEVHHYTDWSLALKTIYDNYKNLKVIYTGSSLLHLTKGRADLSRRTMLYTMHGLSLREYINLVEKKNFQPVSLNDILTNHLELSKSIISEVKPIQHYNEYIQTGYYPFFLENKQTYLFKLVETVNQIIETDLPYVTKISYANINKLKQLLQIISESVPFKPNLEKISSQIEISKNTLKDYLYYLEEAMLIAMLKSDRKVNSNLAKPEKVYLNHPNLMFCLANENSNQGNIRECFFLNQLQSLCTINYSEVGDFLVNKKFIFEIGGKNKTYKQIANIENSFIAADDIEFGHKNTIPLWLFGFLY